jgi:hypothetical protein
MWQAIWDRIKSEPVAIQALIQVTLGLVLAFGVKLTTEQIAAIMAFVGALLAVITRQLVTPMSKINATTITVDQ